LSKDLPLAENIIIIPLSGRIQRYEAHAADQVIGYSKNRTCIISCIHLQAAGGRFQRYEANAVDQVTCISICKKVKGWFVKDQPFLVLKLIMNGYFQIVISIE